MQDIKSCTTIWRNNLESILITPEDSAGENLALLSNLVFSKWKHF